MNNKSFFTFSGYTLEKSIYEQIKNIKCIESTIKELIIDDAFYLCGSITINNNHMDYVNTKNLLTQLDKLDLAINDE